MYRIGEFSTLSKTTIKTLRYYEKEKLLIPSFVEEDNGYRFYETFQLLELSKIISLRQIGLSIDKIRDVLAGESLHAMLLKRKEEVKSELSLYGDQLSRIEYLLEGKEMKYEAMIKEIPEYTVYYKQGVIKDFSAITTFILDSKKECETTNPTIKCIQPDYCYVSYLDGEFKDYDIKILYAQAVDRMGVENATIQFKKLTPVNAVCVYHKGEYQKLGEAYGFAMKWIEENGYLVTEPIRERYIDGMWNQAHEENWLTEIQVPIQKK